MLTDLHHDLLMGRAEATALITEDGDVTFGSLRQRVQNLSGTLFAGSGKQLVLSFLPNSLAMVLIYLSAVTAGHAIGLLPPATPTSRKHLLIDRYRPDVVVTDNGQLDQALESRGYHRLDFPVDGIRAWGHRAFCGLAEDLTLLLSTSGSTGTPKLVRISASSIAANTAGIISSTRITPARRTVTSLPLCYSYGLSVLNSHLAAGAPVVVTGRSPVTSGFWHLVWRNEVTEVAGTPITHRVMLRQPGSRLPPSVRVLTQAGGRLPEQLARAALAWTREAGGEFFCMYGQTEATSRISCLDSARLADKPGSAGTALPGGRISVGAPHAGGEDGPISYTGPNVMMGYATSRDDLTRGNDVYALDTGDLGRLDSDGFLYVTGRSSRFAKVMDRRVSLDDVEDCLGPPGSCAAVTAPDDDTLIVVFTTKRTTDLEAPRRSLAEALGAPVSVFQVRQVSGIPLTINGKVDYAQLRQQAAHRAMAAQ
jgi:acyl-coenzyme A synthetase/AMP-(fatty) acid ligase